MAIDYLHTVVGKTYYFNHEAEQFYLLYDFSAHVGDTVIVHENPFVRNASWFATLAQANETEYFMYEIKEAGDTLINGASLQYQKVKNLSIEENAGWGFLDDVLIEKIGSINYFYGMYFPLILGDWQVSQLRCYQNSQLSFYTEAKWQQDCFQVVGLFDKKQHVSFSVHPNPAASQIRITSAKPIVSLALLDYFGGSVFFGNTETVNVSAYPSGIYFIRAEFDDGSMGVQKLIIE